MLLFTLIAGLALLLLVLLIVASRRRRTRDSWLVSAGDDDGTGIGWTGADAAAIEAPAGDSDAVPGGGDFGGGGASGSWDDAGSTDSGGDDGGDGDSDGDGGD